MNPKVSVIIPCYNFEKYIAECIDGALMQETDFDYEIIVGDDCSTDSSYEIIKSYGHRIRHFRNNKNLGAPRNMNRMMSMARGEYIAHIDGDDFFTDPKKLQKQADFLDANPDYAMHSTGYQYIFEDGSYPDMELIPLQPTLTHQDMENSNRVSFGRMFRNTKGLTDPWMVKSHFHDWCMNYEISLTGKIRCEDWPSGRYRLGAGGMISRLTDAEAREMNNQTIDLIKKRKYMGHAVHIHLFLSDSTEQTAYDNISRLKDFGYYIIATSPKPLPERFYDIVDHFSYDGENILIEGEYGQIEPIYYYTKSQGMTMNFQMEDKQVHSLAVLRSMIRGCQIAKMLGKNRILRIEFDDVLGQKTMEEYRKILSSMDGDMYLFRNDYGDTSDISVHSMFYEPDAFLEIFGHIRTEEDWAAEISNLDGLKIGKHPILEEVMLQMISNSGKSIRYEDGRTMHERFPDSTFNLHQSIPGLINGMMADAMTSNSGIPFAACRCHHPPGGEVKFKFLKSHVQIDQISHTITSDGWAFWEIVHRGVDMEIEICGQHTKSYHIDNHGKISKQDGTPCGSTIIFE